MGIVFKTMLISLSLLHSLIMSYLNLALLHTNFDLYPCCIPISVCASRDYYVGVLYHSIVIADLGAATEPGVPVCCSHIEVLLGARRY
jgi:hypothetical protein